MENLVASQTPVEEAASTQLSIPQNKKEKPKPKNQHKTLSPSYEVLQQILKTPTVSLHNQET